MSRIATLSASNRLLEVMTKVQGRLQEQQVRVTTEKASQDYAGIATKAGRLVSLETARAGLGRSIDDNAIIETRLSAVDTAVEAMGKTMRDFRSVLLDLGSNKPIDEAHVGEVQAFAFRALKDMEGYLNTEVNGRFVFAGSRATTRPANLELATITDFQNRFDGESLIYPPTRAAHVGATATLPPAVTGGLTVSGGDTITAANADTFANLEVGATIRLSGSALGNDGEYTVVSTNGSDRITVSGTLTVGSASMTVSAGVNDGAEAAATLAVGNWYAGDTVDASHRVESERTLSLGLNGIDPAFEKAIRAMGMIAQGQYGTGGGLEQNLERVDSRALAARLGPGTRLWRRRAAGSGARRQRRDGADEPRLRPRRRQRNPGAAAGAGRQPRQPDRRDRERRSAGSDDQAPRRRPCPRGVLPGGRPHPPVQPDELPVDAQKAASDASGSGAATRRSTASISSGVR